MTPCGSNVYTNPNMEIISPSMNVLDLGIYLSGECTFNYHISSLSKSVLIYLLVILTCGCSAASNWKPGPHAVSTIVKCLQSPGCC